MKRVAFTTLTLVFAAALCGAASPPLPEAEGPFASRVPAFSLIPFAALLVSIAVLPLAAPHWWERNANKAKIVTLCSVPLAAYLALRFGHAGIEPLVEKLREYISFMALLASLYVIAGGIYVGGSLGGTPAANTTTLAVGAVLANVLGTTGASMVLIRPLIRANRGRRSIAHILVFFIFIVSNCGGLLTPLGDPPLFLGHLAGVPFGWTFRLFPQWAFVNGSLLAMFVVWDFFALRREPRDAAHHSHETRVHRPLKIEGAWNSLLLVSVVALVFSAGHGLANGGRPWPFGVCEGLLAVLTAASLWVTDHSVRQKHRFTFGPIVEVAVLFAGLFVTMLPALLFLNAHGAQLGVRTPRSFFWASGLLSSVLDNAPTYLTFTAAACGNHGVPLQGGYLGRLLDLHPTSGGSLLAAISCGCVFMGANTYIGNAPNLMVKTIAEEADVRMPGFFGYLLYSIPLLLPIFALASILFFSSGS